MKMQKNLCGLIVMVVTCLLLQPAGARAGQPIDAALRAVPPDTAEPADQSALTAGLTFSWPTTLFQDQFEVGDLYTWVSRYATGGGELGMETEIRHSGRYAARFSLPASTLARNAYLIESYPEQDLVYARCYFYLDSDFNLASGDWVDLFYAARTGVGTLAGVRIKQSGSGSLVLSSSVVGDGTTALTRQAWHSLEIRYARGAGNGALTVWLDGQQELSGTNLTLNYAANEIRAGWVRLSDSSDSQNRGTLYLDDVVVDDEPIGTVEVAVNLLHPDFRSRVGAPVIAVLTGDRPTDRLEASLDSSAGYSQTIYAQQGPLGGRVDFDLDLSGLAAATYTLTTRLLDEHGAERARASVVFEKAYAGDPVVSIDADNNLRVNGKKFFPVTSFGLNRDPGTIASWKTHNYINMLYGQDWSTPYTPARYIEYLDRGADNGLMTWGPMNIGCGHPDVAGETPCTTALYQPYVEAARGHPANAGWSFREEPIYWHYRASDYKEWWDMVKLNDPAKWTHVVEMGLYYHAENEYYIREIHDWLYPYLVADIYGFDVYPIEYGVSMEDMALAADRAWQWNFGLVPFFAFVQTTDCRPGTGGGMPTAAEVRMMSWLMVVHQAKGINWYHYQAATPPENYAAMAQFVTDTTVLADAILGDEPSRTVVDQELGGGRVDVLAREHDGVLYLFAVNLRRQAEEVRFTIGAPSNGAVAEVYNEGRSIPLQDGVFSDSFDPLAVHIYRIDVPGLSLQAIPGNQAIHLSWEVNTTPPPTSTWQIEYVSQTGTAYPPHTGILSPTRAYTLTGLTNYVWYTVTLNAVLDSRPILTDTVRVMPTDRFVYLPLVQKGR
ncbi:MAG: hypothetical protein WHX52_08750 [Anaerolineae bacterium]